MREGQQYVYVAQTSNNRVIAAHELYCCFLPQCEALLICRPGFSDRNTMNMEITIVRLKYFVILAISYEKNLATLPIASAWLAIQDSAGAVYPANNTTWL